MFLNDENLVSLEISNFDTSQVTIMNEMFENCRSLKSINLKNAMDLVNLIYNNFIDMPDKMVFCIDDSGQELYYSYDIIITDKLNSIINCSDDAFI